MGGVSVSSPRHIPIYETLEITLETIAASLRCADLGRLMKRSRRRL
jgi:hypothetical protein